MHHPAALLPQPRQGRAAWRRLASALLTLASCLHHAAQAAEATPPAYRCLDAQGQLSYTQHPCGDQALPMKHADTRNPAQQRQATQNTARDAKLVRQLERARRKAEREAPGPTLIAKNNPLPQPPAASRTPEKGRRLHRRSMPPRHVAAQTPAPSTSKPQTTRPR